MIVTCNKCGSLTTCDCETKPLAGKFLLTTAFVSITLIFPVIIFLFVITRMWLGDIPISRGTVMMETFTFTLLVGVCLGLMVAFPVTSALKEMRRYVK